MPRIVIDTNIFISSLISEYGFSKKILDAWRDKRFILLTCQRLLTELKDTLTKPKIKKLISKTIASELISLIEDRAEFVVVSHPVTQSRDPKDNPFLEVAIAGKAHLLLSSDSDLLVLDGYKGLSIMKPRNFIEWLEEG